VTVGQLLLQPRSGGVTKARHGSAGKANVAQTESALADGTSFVTASLFETWDTLGKKIYSTPITDQASR